MQQEYFSKIIGKKYKIKQGFLGNTVVFEDNVNYTESEYKKLNGLSEMTMRNIHNLKLVFKGVVL